MTSVADEDGEHRGRPPDTAHKGGAPQKSYRRSCPVSFFFLVVFKFIDRFSFKKN